MWWFGRVLNCAMGVRVSKSEDFEAGVGTSVGEANHCVIRD